jgi:hypothetical protein
MGNKLVTGSANSSHNHGSGLGGSNVWVYMDEVKKEFAEYASAHAHYIAADVVKEGWPASSHSHGIIGKGQMLASWHSTVPGEDALDFEEAKPFIRAVIERMLDLIATEENWLKGAAHTRLGDVDSWCLIGAKAQAEADLGLQAADLDTTRRRVVAAVSKYLNAQVEADTDGRHNTMPAFNDDKATSYEDVRLWLKGALHKLDD